MKYMVISDIHGSKYYTKKAIEIFNKEQAHYLIILGDFLYHGPRNVLPNDYDPMEVANMLNSIKEKIIAIHGNCDSEVDQMVLEFPLMDSMTIMIGKRRAFLTHGHIYNEACHPMLEKNDYLIHGHFHIPWLFDVDGVTIASPGSISIPKNNSKNAYMIIDNDVIDIKDLEGNSILNEIRKEA